MKDFKLGKKKIFFEISNNLQYLVSRRAHLLVNFLSAMIKLVVPRIYIRLKDTFRSLSFKKLRF